MADLLRATKLLPDFKAAASVHLVETSPSLKQKQQTALASSVIVSRVRRTVPEMTSSAVGRR